MREVIDKLRELYETMKREQGKPSQCIIRYTVCSPTITVNNPSYGFTKDTSIIKLNKERFRNIDGSMNVLDLGVF